MIKKVIIGILPQIKLKTNDNPYDDKYEFLDLYSKKILSLGAIPIGILLNNGEIDEDALKVCDAFLLPGGNIVKKDYYQTIYYAIKHNKPLLGICLGMHGMGIFSDIMEKMDINNFKEDEFFKVYKDLKEQNEGTLLKKLPSPNIHGDIIVNYDNINSARHKVIIKDKDSLIYDIYKKEVLNVVSLHNYALKWVGKDFKATTYAEDNVIEAIEYQTKGYFILGVQWHPEHDEDNLLFKRLISEAKLRQEKND
jgi:gamma-glutamyl-gamma-aminobutyrate hydrolase PuuD